MCRLNGIVVPRASCIEPNYGHGGQSPAGGTILRPESSKSLFPKWGRISLNLGHGIYRPDGRFVDKRCKTGRMIDTVSRRRILIEEDWAFGL